MKPDRYWHAYCGPCRVYLQMPVRYGRKLLSLMCPRCGRMSIVYKCTPYALKGALISTAYQEVTKCPRRMKD